jgi:NADH-quinone oxidoreductase subunit J
MLPALFFYAFATLALISSLLVIFSKNPIYSVLWLIFTFFNAAGLFMLLGAEFLSMMLIIVYVGAVMVLFLFVLMMLDIDFQKIKRQFTINSIFGFLVVGLMFANIALAIFVSSNSVRVISRSDYPIQLAETNTHAIGKILYTDFVLHFQAAGALLFVAMIGSIALTLRHKDWVKRQDAGKQVSRTEEGAVEVVKVGIREGVDDIAY